MKGISLKRAAQLREYSAQRKHFLDTKPLCRVCFKYRAAEIHHMRGRVGKLLLDQRWWLPVCWNCHRKIHDHPAWAREHGFRL